MMCCYVRGWQHGRHHSKIGTQHHSGVVVVSDGRHDRSGIFAGVGSTNRVTRYSKGIELVMKVRKWIMLFHAAADEAVGIVTLNKPV